MHILKPKVKVVNCCNARFMYCRVSPFPFFTTKTSITFLKEGWWDDIISTFLRLSMSPNMDLSISWRQRRRWKIGSAFSLTLLRKQVAFINGSAISPVMFEHQHATHEIWGSKHCMYVFNDRERTDCPKKTTLGQNKLTNEMKGKYKYLVAF